MRKTAAACFSPLSVLFCVLTELAGLAGVAGLALAQDQPAASAPVTSPSNADPNKTSPGDPAQQNPSPAKSAPAAPAPTAASAAAADAAQPVALTVPKGVPLHLALTQKVAIKNAGVPVEGQVVEPVYVFDHLVIPAGSRVTGRVTKVESASRGRRAMAIANGNFTPLRTAHVDFDTLVLKDGTRVPLYSIAIQGAPRMVHLEAGENGKKKKGRAGQAVEQARAEVKSREQETLEELKAPGKMDRLKSGLAAELPYHRQALAVGTHFTAELTAPLELGKEDHPQPLSSVGVGGIAPGSIVRVRLETPLSSASDHKGDPVRAVVSEPVFSSNRQDLILPEGTRLEGVVTQALPARRLGRNGELRFMFRQVDTPAGAARQVEASLQAVEAPTADHMELDPEGTAHAVTPKTKYVAPAVQVMLAVGSLDGLDGNNRDRIEDGLGPQGPDVAGGAVRGGAGFGLIGTAVGLAAHWRPVSAAFAFYGAGWSVYTHVVERGSDVVFPKNTRMEIRFGTHGDTAKPPAPASPPAQKLLSGGL